MRIPTIYFRYVPVVFVQAQGRGTNNEKATTYLQWSNETMPELMDKRLSDGSESKNDGAHTMRWGINDTTSFFLSRLFSEIQVVFQRFFLNINHQCFSFLEQYLRYSHIYVSVFFFGALSLIGRFA